MQCISRYVKHYRERDLPFETYNGIDFRPRVLLTLMQNAIHALYIFLFASDMATDSILLERVSVAFKTQNETVLKDF